MPATNIFSGSDPYDVGIVRVNGYAAYGIGRFSIKNGSPSDTGVFCFPNAPRANGYVP
jgi:hypothetical protein